MDSATILDEATNDPLVVTTRIGDYNVEQILIDCGSVVVVLH